MAHPCIRWLGLGFVALALAGCASMAQRQLADNLGRAVLNQDDPATVREGAPAFLLLLDGMLEGDPDNVDLLIAGARLNAAYAAVFVDDTERAGRLARKAHGYAGRALCLRQPSLCKLDVRPFAEYEVALAPLGQDALPVLYTYGVTWAGVIEQQGDWQAAADLPKVEAVLDRVVAIDETYERGQAHVYLGAMRSLVPPTLGGKPEIGRAHFERAIALSQGRNLMAQVEFAQRYARLTLDRPLHDRLLNEVVAADPVEPGLTLSNVLAQAKATELLASAPQYFPE
jgi:TRAP transporter T-component